MAAKLPGPSNGQNNVQVYDPSALGRAIIMNERRGQMCRAFFSIWNSPPGPGGMVSSL